MATSQEIIDQARGNLKIDPNKKIWADADLLRWMNEGIGKFEAKTDWYRNIQSETPTLVNGTSLYALPTGFRIILDKSVRFTNAAGDVMRLPLVEYSDLVNDVVNVNVSDDYPQYVYLKRGNMGVYPKPNATMAAGTLSYEYYGFTDDYILTDTVDFPQNNIEVLEFYIEYRAWGIVPGKRVEMRDALEKYNIAVTQAMTEKLRQRGPTFEFRTMSKPSKSL